MEHLSVPAGQPIADFRAANTDSGCGAVRYPSAVFVERRRDVLEPNLSGIVWVHAVVRTFIGWTSPAFLGLDLLVVLAIGLLLGRLATSATASQQKRHPIQAAVLLGALLFYLSTSEWCHCQRDTWMLLPCLLALMIRINVLQRMKVERVAVPKI